MKCVKCDKPAAYVLQGASVCKKCKTDFEQRMLRENALKQEFLAWRMKQQAGQVAEKQPKSPEKGAKRGRR